MEKARVPMENPTKCAIKARMHATFSRPSYLRLNEFQRERVAELEARLARADMEAPSNAGRHDGVSTIPDKLVH
jgi:hypothetical protein